MILVALACRTQKPVTDFTSEPSPVMIKLKNVEAGYASDTIQLVINKE